MTLSNTFPRRVNTVLNLYGSSFIFFTSAFIKKCMFHDSQAAVLGPSATSFRNGERIVPEGTAPDCHFKEIIYICMYLYFTQPKYPGWNCSIISRYKSPPILPVTFLCFQSCLTVSKSFQRPLALQQSLCRFQHFPTRITFTACC